MILALTGMRKGEMMRLVLHHSRTKCNEYEVN